MVFRDLQPLSEDVLRQEVVACLSRNEIANLRELPRGFIRGAAAIDIGATMHVAAVGPDRLIRNPSGLSGLSPMTLHRLADWFAPVRELKTVVMESTGVYWIPVFEILGTAGLRSNGGQRARRRSTCRGVRLMSATRNGCNVCNEYGLLRASFPGPRWWRKSPDCVPTSGSGSGYWITQRRISSTCKKR